MKRQTFFTTARLEITNEGVEAKKNSQLHIAPGSIEGTNITVPQQIKSEHTVPLTKEGGGSIDVLEMGKPGADVASETVQTIGSGIPAYFNAPPPFNQITDHRAPSTAREGR